MTSPTSVQLMKSSVEDGPPPLVGEEVENVFDYDPSGTTTTTTTTTSDSDLGHFQDSAYVTKLLDRKEYYRDPRAKQAITDEGKSLVDQGTWLLESVRHREERAAQ